MKQEIKYAQCYECGEPTLYQCEDCEQWFCLEHGKKGGDRQIQDISWIAYPSLCEACKLCPF